jgi:hypothetical protein
MVDPVLLEAIDDGTAETAADEIRDMLAADFEDHQQQRR